MSKKWKTYEDVARFLIQKFKKEFDLEEIEGKQKIKGNVSNTSYEIEAKGAKKEGEGFVIIECRRYTTSRQNQEKIGALAYRIYDTGAEGGIIISPLGLQKGAKLIATSENITSVLLDENSTTENYVMKFLNKVMVGISEKITVKEKISFKIIKKGE